MSTKNRIDFRKLGREVLGLSDTLVSTWLPNGKKEGHEYVALNPNRYDKQLGSFRINLKTGKWADFATGDRGSDLISLYAFVYQCSQYDAAIVLMRYV